MVMYRTEVVRAKPLNCSFAAYALDYDICNCRRVQTYKASEEAHCCCSVVESLAHCVFDAMNSVEAPKIKSSKQDVLLAKRSAD